MNVNAACDCSAECGTCLRCGAQSTVYTQLTSRRLPVLRVRAMFEGFTKFCFVFRFGFHATLLDFASRIERLHTFAITAHYMKSYSALYNEYSRAGPSTTRSGMRVCVAVFMTCMIPWA